MVGMTAEWRRIVIGQDSSENGLRRLLPKRAQAPKGQRL